MSETAIPSDPKPQPPKREMVPITDVAVIRTKDGVLRLFKQDVFLSVGEKTLLQIPGMRVKVGQDEWQQMYVVSAEGYKRMAKAASIICVNAPTVAVDGVQQANPHVIRDDKGAVRCIYCRSLAFGYTPLGVPVVSDRTAIFDLPTYKLVDMLAKAKKFAVDFKIMPADGERPGKEWARYPIDDASVLWANTTCAEYTDWMVSMVNRQRKAVEIAQTFAQRNAIKHHPSMQVHQSPSKTLMAPVLSWIPTEGVMRWDMSAWQTALKQVSDLAHGDASTPSGHKVEVVRGEDEVHRDAEVVGAEAKADVDEAGPAEADDDAVAAAGAKFKALSDAVAAMAGRVAPKRLAKLRVSVGLGAEPTDFEDSEDGYAAKIAALHNVLEAELSKGGGK